MKKPPIVMYIDDDVFYSELLGAGSGKLNTQMRLNLIYDWMMDILKDHGDSSECVAQVIETLQGDSLGYGVCHVMDLNSNNPTRYEPKRFGFCPGTLVTSGGSVDSVLYGVLTDSTDEVVVGPASMKSLVDMILADVPGENKPITLCHSGSIQG